MARPTVIPGKFSGEESWDQWIFHFESAADINKWDAAAKLQWLKISLTGRALASFQRLSPQSIADYKTAKETLQERFEPSCRRERYQTELQTAKRKKEEGWADLADRLRIMSQKGYPDLEDKAGAERVPVAYRQLSSSFRCTAEKASYARYCCKRNIGNRVLRGLGYSII